MTYELLKRLMESGFPLQQVTVEVGREVALERPAVVFSGASTVAEAGIYYVPSLSDLVDACGTRLSTMTRVPEGWECTQAPHGPDDAKTARTRGVTLFDALAELWLADSRTRR
ncbi:MAG TPA: hypothetical protein VEQ10_22605 [Vicinamibacteria bacterium]|nr:hypothetical protein [Vicinamibacteria bacterium]